MAPALRPYAINLNNPFDPGERGTIVNIYGSNFGSTIGTSKVTFNRADAEEYPIWSDTHIQCKVPGSQYNDGELPSASSGSVNVITSAGTSNSTQFNVSFSTTNKKFSNSSITFYVNQNGTSDCDGEFTAIQNALQTWCGINYSNHTFVYGGTTTRSPGSRNGYNDIGWITSNWPYDPSDIAVNLWWFDATDNSNLILESDILINNVNFTWSTTGQTGRMDVQNILTHELGHALNLHDLYGDNDAEKTMYGYSVNGETKQRSLETDDIAGAVYLYPQPYSFSLQNSFEFDGTNYGQVTVKNSTQMTNSIAYNSPLNTTVNYGSSFVLSIPTTSPIVNSRNYSFYSWNNNSTSTIRNFSPTGNTEITAFYKGHMLSSLTSATGSNGQRTLVRDNNGAYSWLHLVYQSNGEIWYTRSSDNGTTWLPEIRVSSGTGTAHNPTISDPCYSTYCLFVIWVDNCSTGPGYGYSIYGKKLHTDDMRWGDTKEITGINFLTLTGYAKYYTKPAAISFWLPTPGNYCLVSYEDTLSGLTTILDNVHLTDDNDTWNCSITGGTPGTSSYNPSLFGDLTNNKVYLAYDNGLDIYMKYWDLSLHPTSGYFSGPYTVSNSSFASPNTNPSVTADQTGRVHFAWKAFDHSLYYINAIFARSLSWQGFSWSSLNEFTFYNPFDQPTICGHNDSDGGASLLFHRSDNYVYKVYTSNGTTWVSSPGILIGSNSYNPAVISAANPTLVPYVWTTNSAAPYVIPFQKYNEVTHTLAKEDANVPGNSSKKLVTFTASQSVLLSNSSGNDKYLINFSGLQFSKLNTTSLPVSLLANSGRNNSLISLNSDNSANSVSSSDGYTLSGSIKYYSQTTGTKIKVVLMDTVNNSIVQQITGLTISNPDELDTVNIQIPLNNGINLKNTAVKFLINGVIDSSYTCTLVNTYFLNDSTNVQVKQTAGLVETVPTEYALNQNYPNPFNPSTVIEYQLPKDGFVNLKVYDILGREVRTLVNGYKTIGKYSVSFDASKLASGIYIYELKSNDFSSIKKMMLTK